MSNVKIMLIDDSKTINATTEMFLKNESYDLITVNNGFDALSQIMEHKPDVIFLDILMPKLDGIQTCQILKANDELKDIPIIFLSSKDGEFDKARGIMIGAADYLTKPFTKDGLIKMVEKHVK